MMAEHCSWSFHGRGTRCGNLISLQCVAKKVFLMAKRISLLLLCGKSTQSGWMDKLKELFMESIWRAANTQIHKYNDSNFRLTYLAGWLKSIFVDVV